MREIVAKKITETVKNLCIEANTNLSEDVVEALNKALSKEDSPIGREILRQLINNAKVAWRDKLPLCQDTGIVIVFFEIGQDARIIEGTLEEAVNEGVSRAYHDGYLRKSVVADPIKRKNTEDNTPAIIYTKIVPGESIKIQLLTKGGGAENCSALRMFNPNSPKEEIDDFVIEAVEKAGPNSCPPVIVGIGVGGSFDYAPVLAKKALLREVGRHHSEKDTANWEKELLEKINKTGIGPMGLGGRITALAVNIEKYPCHISSLPVAVNIECHAHRYKEAAI
ncbi:fumarate hydratase [candidate division WOR-1 bacterium DG_54_3]|uniref:Fumarate hydratase n=1 Tax=candidate division WOR-1 bacterium DG_54_3 TaxID=1703775 RepID=A0A0S7Y478_UNCSA|nr:MAG: fumarate hydratase [candidate division WOR-1 bacterium DG_54_3]